MTPTFAAIVKSQLKRSDFMIAIYQLIGLASFIDKKIPRVFVRVRFESAQGLWLSIVNTAERWR